MGPVALRSPTVFAVGREQDGKAGWERHNAQTLIALDCQSEPGALFQGLEANMQLDRIHLALVRADHHRVERSSVLIESDPSDSVAVYAMLSGRSAVTWNGGRTILSAGQAMVIDADRPFARSFDGGVHELVIKVPRTVMGDLANPVLGDDLYTHALIASVSRTVGRAEVPEPDEGGILDLVTAVATGGRGDPSTMRRAAARAFVDTHFGDSGLSAADVAEGVGVSERQLSRVFAAANTSIPRYVLGRRLDAAWSLLTRAPELTTATVAARCGFTSPAHFSRSFHRRFGVSAGQVRRG